MSAPIIHRCGHCGYEAEITSSLSAFTEDPFCRQCGLSASESDSKLQDELSRLMDQQLNFNQPQPAPITYITQHYHHSGHIARQPEPAEQLSAAGIDASVLSAAQMRLFSNALPEQQARLIELWQIAPPRLAERTVGNWPQTSLEEEEAAAHARYLKMTSPITLDQQTTIQIPQIVIAPGSPEDHQHQHAEPYMSHGYSQNSENHRSPETNRVINYNRALDPVYEGREWWNHGNNAPETQMENQYGAYTQMREHYGPVHQTGLEDEMML